MGPNSWEGERETTGGGGPPPHQGPEAPALDPKPAQAGGPYPQEGSAIPFRCDLRATVERGLYC